MRGRPRTNGVKRAWMLARTLIVLKGFDEARNKGAKHEAAISEAVYAVRSCLPEMPISRTEVKRILAELRSKRSEETFLVTEEMQNGPAVARYHDGAALLRAFSRGNDVPSDPGSASKPMQVLSIRIGPPPSHPRSNAKTLKK